MAANWMRISSRAIASVGKRVIGHRIPNSSPAISWSGLVHTSAYDKNVEASATGDDDQVIFEQLKFPEQEEKEEGKHHYWEPHPQTGVFGPVSAAGSGASSGTKATSASTDALEEKAWFRPTSLEDLEKPHPHP
ncbi:Late embryogenesis abundant protein At5g17165 [Linum perenne]